MWRRSATLVLSIASIASLPGCGRSARAANHRVSSSVLRAAGAAVCSEMSVGDDLWQDRLGTHTLADRGTILACSHVLTADREAVADNLFARRDIAPVSAGSELFVVQYVTEGAPGVARAATALFYLPIDAASNVPIVAVDHSTSGIGPSCGPTHHHVLVDPIAVPFVAHGYAVVAPDYPGMGVDNGMTSYLVGRVEANATLDAIRALKHFHDDRFDASQLGTDLFVVGYSQGGHAALFTHQSFDTSVGVHLLGSVAFAPGFGDLRDWSSHFTHGSAVWDEMSTYALMSLYSQMLYRGGPEPSTWLSPVAQWALPPRLHGQCSLALTPELASIFHTQGDVYQPAFIAAAAACSFRGPCPGFEPWASALAAEEPGNFASTVPTLIVQGLADTLVPPAVTACTVRRLAAHGTPVQACAYVNATHLNIVPTAFRDVFRWVTARRAGDSPAVCPAPLDVACAQ